ncbi:flavodoxin [Campylobacter sp. FMV-PI01]|uniref:Flavodoxin n=1 Tax=Campylobacter portucalensis TaxID=2608384 RepID=A0A6L5WIA2_9BACT|nr:flavodoxin family protein [Campylobacter portucalensis]MSN96859.1 flavodoxin [Campylobacter portucalensis]
MKNLVVYASKTGNTKKVAIAIARSLKYELKSVDEIRNLNEVDKLIFGFYVDKGDMSDDAKRVALMIKNRKIGLFMTLGSKSNSDHAKECFLKIKNKFVENGCEILGEFYCQGAVDPNLISWMRENLRDTITEEKERNWKEASTHPDDNDLTNAVLAFENFE